MNFLISYVCHGMRHENPRNAVLRQSAAAILHAALVQGVVGIVDHSSTRRGALNFTSSTAGLMSGPNPDDWDVAYSIEWISVEKARASIDLVLDVEALHGEISHELDCHDGIITHSGSGAVRENHDSAI